MVISERIRLRKTRLIYLYQNNPPFLVKDYVMKDKKGECRKWGLYQCYCGNLFLALMSGVKSGGTKSCGCLFHKYSQGRNTTHNLTNSPLYYIWAGMKTRCYDKTSRAYKNYGLRGIIVCERWLDFGNFHNDMFASWSKGLSLDRIDNNGNYSLDNCRWATPREQNFNKRTNKILEYKGEKKCCGEWAIILGVDQNTLWTRINRGWSIKDAIETPVQIKNKKDEKGKFKKCCLLNN